MDVREFENLKIDINNLKQRKVRGEEQLKIVKSKLSSDVKEILKMTGAKDITEAREIAKKLKVEFDEKQAIFSEKYSEFKTKLGDL